MHPAIGVTAGTASFVFAHPLPTLAVGVTPEVAENVGGGRVTIVPWLVYCGTALALCDGTFASDGGLGRPESVTPVT